MAWTPRLMRPLAAVALLVVTALLTTSTDAPRAVSVDDPPSQAVIP